MINSSGLLKIALFSDFKSTVGRKHQLTLLHELSKSELLFEPPDLDDLAEEKSSRFFLATSVPVEADPRPLEVVKLPVPPEAPPPIPGSCPPSVEVEL